VAGLSAIGTSKAMGSVVRAWDVRDVSDQAPHRWHRLGDLELYQKKLGMLGH